MYTGRSQVVNNLVLRILTFWFQFLQSITSQMKNYELTEGYQNTRQLYIYIHKTCNFEITVSLSWHYI